MQVKNIVYLYSEVMPYAISVMRVFVKEFGITVDCISWDNNKKTPFVPTNEQGITFYKRSTFDKESMFKFIEEKNPSVMIFSGRMDKTYLECAVHFRDKIKTVSFCDTQWEGTRKNILTATLSNFVYRKYFEYFWIPSHRSYEYVRRMGYPKNKIINNSLTGDDTIFQQPYRDYQDSKKVRYPHSIVFVGRFAREKGLDLLIEAFTNAKNEVKNDWSLTLVGSGTTPAFNSPDIFIKDFMSSATLAAECKNWGVFCLPSLKEPWGIVMHEFTMAGLPIICSDNVGASDALVVNNYNGYVFETGNSDDLKNALLKMMSKSDVELCEMGKRSHEISKCQSPLIAAYSLMGIIK